MTFLHRARQAVRLGVSLRKFLSAQIDPATARSAVGQRVREREETFLAAADRLIWGVPSSPYRKLLLKAGCDRQDLASAVRSAGLERSLEKLRDAGVCVSLDEFRGRTPIVRPGLEIDAPASAFDNPFLQGRSVAGTTSGTSSAPRRVLLDWAGLAEEALDNFVLYDTHGLLDAPVALWLVSPGMAALNALMVNAKRGRPPERWFAPVALGFPDATFFAALAPYWGQLVGRTAGLALPRPEPVGVDQVHIVAEWMAERTSPHAPCVLRTSASAAVRVADIVRNGRAGGAGGVMLVAGEPLTPARRRAIESAGFTATPHYGAAEVGLLAGACGRPTECDDMHLFIDRLAVIQRGPGPRSAAPDRLLFTSLSPNVGQVLLNTDIGDDAQVVHRSCGCLLGELGMTLHVSKVRSRAKLTGEGVALLGGELDDAVAACIERVGGSPNDYQFWEQNDGAGATRLVLAIAPELEIDEQHFLDHVLDELRATAVAGRLVAEIWKKAATLQLVRARPRATVALKLPSFVSQAGRGT